MWVIHRANVGIHIQYMEQMGMALWIQPELLWKYIFAGSDLRGLVWLSTFPDGVWIHKSVVNTLTFKIKKKHIMMNNTSSMNGIMINDAGKPTSLAKLAFV